MLRVDLQEREELFSHRMGLVSVDYVDVDSLLRKLDQLDVVSNLAARLCLGCEHHDRDGQIRLFVLDVVRVPFDERLNWILVVSEHADDVLQRTLVLHAVDNFTFLAPGNHPVLPNQSLLQSPD